MSDRQTSPCTTHDGCTATVTQHIDAVGRTVTHTDHDWTVDSPLAPPDSDLEPIVVFDEDDLIWIITCQSPDCPKVIADVRLSRAMARYEEHRDLPRFIDPTHRHITADALAV